MPSAQVHNTVNLAALVGGLALGWTTGLVHLEPCVPFAVGFLFSTLLLSPDLDLAASVRVDARKNWGVLGALWMPFGRLVKHRGVTHTFVRGPVVLLAYLGVLLSVLAGLGWLVVQGLELKVPVVRVEGVWVGWWMTGLLTAHGLHLVLDGYRPWVWRRW